MLKLYVTAAAVALAVIVAGTWAWIRLAPDADCGGTNVAGAIGGSFTLVSETGETVTDADVIDRPALIYFGYTFCPDVCPIDVARNALAVDILAERGIEVRPVFITVDPARDTPAVLEAFTDNLHPQMLGLTGDDDALRDAARAYRVYADVRDDGSDYYLVDHSAFSYLATPAGVIDIFGREDDAEELAARISCHLQ